MESVLKTGIIVLFFFLGSTLVFSQECTDPWFCYHGSEFTRAADLWEKEAETRILTRDEQLKLLTCYVNIGRTEKGLELVRILFDGSIEDRASVLNAKALLLFQAGRFDEAIDLTRAYKRRDDPFGLPPLLEENCVYSRDHPEELAGSITPHELNTNRSESFVYLNNDLLLLKEVSQDSILRGRKKANWYEKVVFLRPYMQEGTEWKEWKIFDKKHRYWSLTSIQWDSQREIIYFTATQPLSKGKGKSKLYWAAFEGFSSPVTHIRELDFDGALKKTVTNQLTLSADGNWLVFSATGDSTAKSDLMQAHLENNKWQSPVALPGINTAEEDSFPLLEGNELRFSTNGRVGYGGLDVWWVAWENGVISGEPTLFGKPINSSRDDFWLYGKTDSTMEFTSNRFTGLGYEDVFLFENGGRK